LTPKALNATGVPLEGESAPSGPARENGDEEPDVTDEAFEAEVAELRARGELAAGRRGRRAVQVRGEVALEA